MNIIDERSSMLWHGHPVYIFREKMKRLIKEGILHDLNFSNLVCVLTTSWENPC